MKSVEWDHSCSSADEDLSDLTQADEVTFESFFFFFLRVGHLCRLSSSLSVSLLEATGDLRMVSHVITPEPNFSLVCSDSSPTPIFREVNINFILPSHKISYFVPPSILFSYCGRLPPPHSSPRESVFKAFWESTESREDKDERSVKGKGAGKRVCAPPWGNRQIEGSRWLL